MARDAITVIESVIEIIGNKDIPLDEDIIREEIKEIIKKVTRRDVELISTEEIAKEQDEIVSVVDGSSEYTFFEGEEENFAKFLEDYFKYYSNIKLGKKMLSDCILNYVYFNSMEHLNFNKLWEFINKKIEYDYDSSLIKIIRDILNRISFDSFQNGMRDLDNYLTMYEYYMLYGNIHSMKPKESINKYLTFTKRLQDENTANNDETKRKVDEALLSAFITLLCCFSDGSFFNNVDYQNTIIESIRALLPVIDLDSEVLYGDTKSTLRNVIPCVLTNTELVEIDGVREIIKDFLNLEAGIVFNANGNSTNVIELAALIGDIDYIRRILSTTNIKLCSGEKYEKLKEEYICPLYEYGDPEDLITFRVPNERFSHDNLLELLLNDKVKMLSMQLIVNIKRKGFLDNEELKTLLDHIQGNDVLVYEYIGGAITDVDDVYQRLKELYSVKS